MTPPVFSPGPAADPTFANLLDSQDAGAVEAREECERLWAKFEPHADRHFLTQIRLDFQARFWEMYLVVTLLELGHDISCPKPGPDAGVVVENLRIWFEAVTPKPGVAADKVPPIIWNQFTAVPNEQMILRYLNSIDTKFQEQYPLWRQRGIVGAHDALIVAINPSSLGRDLIDSTPPRILQAAFPLGMPYVTVDPNGGGIVGDGYQQRYAIRKASGRDVPTGAFMQSYGADLSALLCSRVNVSRYPRPMGRDFQLVPNPLARARLPDSFRLPGTYYPATLDASGDLHVTVIP
jgi:hypothetical protein